MPKEVMEVESASVGSNGHGEVRQVVVGWGRGMGVQLATIAPGDPEAKIGSTESAEAEPVGEVWARHRADVQTIQVPTAMTYTPAPPAGLYVDLQRHEINRLIRNLRKARDEAFGRDE